MLAEADRLAPRETGGVLLGYTANHGRDIVVTVAIGPGPKARHELQSFEPDHDWQVEQVAREYEASGRLYGYLGDWHTHPNGSADLSSKDSTTLKRIACAPEARAPQPIMVIASAGQPWVLVGWRMCPRAWWRVAVEAQRLTMR